MRDIALECNPDEALVRTLGYVRKQIYHQNSKGGVINFLRKNPSALGMVDEDPGTTSPGYMSLFQKEGETKLDLEFFRIRTDNTCLIVIKPNLESWILKYALEAGALPGSLPSNSKDLHKVINRRIPQFRQLLAAMITLNSPALKYLKELIERE